MSIQLLNFCCSVVLGIPITVTQYFLYWTFCVAKIPRFKTENNKITDTTQVQYRVSKTYTANTVEQTNLKIKTANKSAFHI